MEILKNKKILVISPEPWQHNFVSKHHYAIQLANRGNSVFFLNPPSSRNLCDRTAFASLFTLDYRQLFRGLNRLPAFLSRILSGLEIERIRSLAETEFDVVWSFDPYRLQFLDKFGAKCNIYFSADWHSARKLESLVAAHAHIVLSPSTLVMNLIKTDTPVFFVNHAVAKHFLSTQKKAALPGQNVLKVGYVGNLQSKYIDYPLLRRVVEKNRSLDFIFAGDAQGGIPPSLRDFVNVYFPGVLPNDAVPSFLVACDILLLCYDTVSYPVAASNSHKIMEYLASGQTVVSTRIAEYVGRPELVLMPGSNEDLPAFLNEVTESLYEHNNDSRRQTRKRFASQYTYEQQLIRIEGLIREIHVKFDG